MDVSEHIDSQSHEGSVLLIGVGNEFRSDDGAGLYVVRELRRRGMSTACDEPLSRIVILEADGEGTALMRLWEGARAVFMVDAVRSGRPPGTVHRIEASKERLPRDVLGPSSHSFGVTEAVELSRTLHLLPSTVLLYGIDGQTFDQGRGLSDPVLRGLPTLIALIERDCSLLRVSGGVFVFPPSFTIL
jgi:hydrogenase maturation protease